MGTLHRLPLPPRPPKAPEPKQPDRHEELTAYTARHDSPWELAERIFWIRDAVDDLEDAERVLELRVEQHLDTRQERAAVDHARQRIRKLLPKKVEEKR